MRSAPCTPSRERGTRRIRGTAVAAVELCQRRCQAVVRGRAQPCDVGPTGAVALARVGHRRATCTDLWAALTGSPAARLLDDSRLDRGATLFALFHGGRAPDIALPDGRDVLIVLRNDNYTTQEFVCGLLRDV